jgi:hypothetical protein
MPAVANETTKFSPSSHSEWVGTYVPNAGAVTCKMDIEMEKSGLNGGTQHTYILVLLRLISFFSFVHRAVF